MSELKPGDVLEITTDGGLAYVQVTHMHPSYPPVVRALDGLHEDRPADLGTLVAGETRFMATIPVDRALAQAGAACSFVENVAVPEAYSAFPTFRMPIRDKQGEIVYWWFWDGRGLSYDAELDAEQAKLPLREVMSGKRFLQLLSDMAV
ncbi:MAG: hypothetical protein ACU0CX_08575 [Sagittula sp.]|uniref:hypothetical protein n=1 Tax=Sagittula sp. TaxID=2038081 RepID=UPI0040583D9B